MRFCVLITHHQSSCAHSVEFCVYCIQRDAAICGEMPCTFAHSVCVELIGARRVLIYSLVQSQHWTNISHANLFSAIAFTSMLAVCFVFFPFERNFLSSKCWFFFIFSFFFVYTIYNFHFQYNGFCVWLWSGARALAYRTRNASLL